jgi:hydroxymethyl cephem carbamoyltransferase
LIIPRCSSSRSIPGHDGAIAVIKDRRPLFSIESEKDSWRRHMLLTPHTLLDAASPLDDVPVRFVT